MKTPTVNDEAFISAKTSILRIPDLTLGEKVLMMRIASFNEYFESAEHCAETLGFTVATVRRMKRTLKSKGYVVDVESSTHKSCCTVREDFRRDDSPKETAEPITPNTDTSMLKPVKPQKKERNDAWTRWKKQYPELIPALDACTNYLAWRKIPLLDPRKLRNQLTITANALKEPDKPDIHVRTIISYIHYLESDEYLYQAEHTKFCPIITSQDDLFRKFNSVREFKWDESRHYDPNKVLTR